MKPNVQPCSEFTLFIVWLRKKFGKNQSWRSVTQRLRAKSL